MGLKIFKKFIRLIACCSTLEEEHEEEEPPDKNIYPMEMNKQDEKKLRELSIREEDKLKKGDIIKSYTDVKYISNGQFAKVYHAKDMYNNDVALKRVHKDFERMVRRECNMLYHINSDNVIKLLDVFRRGDYYYMVMPYYGKDLFDGLMEVMCRNPFRIYKIINGIATGIYDLHKLGYMHGDIKMENIMLNNYYRPIIIDFGLSKRLEHDKNLYKNKISGTAIYIPPEVIDNRLYTNKMDVWSLGVIMYILMFGYDPFNYMNDHRDKHEMFKNIKYMQAKYPMEWKVDGYLVCKNNIIYKKFVSLNDKMLDKNHMNRISIGHVLELLKDIRGEFEADKSRMSLKVCHKEQIRHLKRFRSM